VFPLRVRCPAQGGMRWWMEPPVGVRAEGGARDRQAVGVKVLGTVVG